MFNSLMPKRLAFLWAFFAGTIAFGESTTNRTLLRVSHRGVPLDIRHVSRIMTQTLAASGGLVESLSQDDHDCERCFARDDMVYDLKAIGIQIVDSRCPVGHSQILNYLRRAKNMLSIDFDCEPDSRVTLHPILAADMATCTGGNSVLGTNDPGSSCQPNLEVIHLAAAWEAARSAGRKLEDVVLAISDTGVDMTHPDLVNQFWRNPADNSIGYNFITNSIDVTDRHSHGTHCAGNSAAQTDNNIGIAGVANINGSVPNVKLMILKMLDDTGNGFMSDAARAINFAVENGAAFSSHSYRWYTDSEIMRAAFTNAAAAGHMAVTAAGNERVNLAIHPTFPCTYANEIPSMLCVAASTSDPTEVVIMAPFSNAGFATKIAAPGIDVYSTLPGGSYGYMSGTSMSTPTTAGVAALLGTLGLESQEITDILIKSRTDGLPNWLEVSDIGVIDASKAVQAALGSPATRLRKNI
ncbi:Major intracellular serine protease precursor, putative [Perkinsus marinus ATCC 50983]|uniref:subtilisin n=1 Tax=Perkinsus marinus (strain ATCC 50983 / TXsc) TaxID=423536 RepID=C5L4R5_PERM5|nr:Major intracellular serine protease precursor, putative [Perkinsus marinus ATCC 50983]EER08256.1 Major intracellular serine protease precursor, putative [Perkinsus marinus ATCC 50983]|eukprot:XP_002776440.1 Major intracellular serine protease precursor, putative [Perkinsus marinus ATCC 50983]